MELEKTKLPADVSFGKEADIDFSKPRIGIWVETSLPMDVFFEGLRLSKTTKRGSTLDMHGFKYDAERKTFGFYVSTFIHTSWNLVWAKMEPKSLIAMTFGDYCWTISDGTNKLSIQETDTPLRDKFEGTPVLLGDLTQVLPSKFADDIIDTLAVMNWHVLEGIIEEAVLYGPFIKQTEEK